MRNGWRREEELITLSVRSVCFVVNPYPVNGYISTMREKLDGYG